jgi:hypothetical protein
VSYQSEVLADSPIVYFRLNEPSGTTANDLGSADNDGDVCEQRACVDTDARRSRATFFSRKPGMACLAVCVFEAPPAPSHGFERIALRIHAIDQPGSSVVEVASVVGTTGGSVNRVETTGEPASLARLQVMHSTRRFSSRSSPPWLRGRMWSRDSRLSSLPG